MDSQSLVIRSHLAWLTADRDRLKESLKAAASPDDAKDLARWQEIQAEIAGMDEMIRRYQLVLEEKMPAI